MRARTVFLALGLLLAAPADASPVTWYTTGDITTAGLHVWRGIVRRGGWAVQPDASITVGSERVRFMSGTLRNVDLTLGAWADRDWSGGRWTEVDPWLQLGAAAGPVDLAGGVTRYLYHGHQPPPVERTSDDSTTELFLRLTGGPERLFFTGGWWLDVDEVGGSYFETGLGLIVPLNPFPFPDVADPVFSTLEMDLTAGWCVDQNVQAGQNANFERNGITHVAMSLSSTVLVKHAVSLEPAMVVQVNSDRFTGNGENLTAWFQVTLAPVKLFGTRAR